jgi:hypothetical protein
LPLPGETLSSHLEAIRQMMDLGIDQVLPYTTMLLPAAELGAGDVERYQMTLRYRVIPNDFGAYLGKRVVETEEVCVSTRHITLEEYFHARAFHLVVYCYYNGDTYAELYEHLRAVGYHPYDFSYDLLRQMDLAPEAVRALYARFIEDARAELRETEEEIHRRYAAGAGYARLVEGSEGANLLVSYQVRSFERLPALLEHAAGVARRGLVERGLPCDDAALESIHAYILHSRGSILEVDERPATIELPYDVHAWKVDGFRRPLADYQRAARLEFMQTAQQRELIEQYARAHGDTADGRAFMLRRIDKATLYRRVTAAGRADPPARAGAALHAQEALGPEG